MRVGTATLLLVSALSSGCVGGGGQEKTPVVALMTDFGLQDDAVGLMRGVVHSISPAATLADVTHRVPRFDVRAGARLIADAPGYYPDKTIFVLVVDPGVGTSRRVIAARLPNESILVAPDNGIITRAVENHGPAQVREVTKQSLFLSEMSSTFHGRDVFAPVGAHLAKGVPFAELGKVITDWVRISALPARKGEKELSGVVEAIDEPFGNVWTSIPAKWLEGLKVQPGQTLRVTIGNKSPKTFKLPYVAQFADVGEGEGLAYANSRGFFALALNMKDFARTHGVQPGMQVRVQR